MYRKPALSLIELLVVLAITAVLIGMGSSALILLRDRAVTKQAVDEFVQNFTGTRNLARNSVSVLSPGTTPGIQDDVRIAAQLADFDHYAIIFANESYARGVCKNLGNFLDCSAVAGSLKTSIYDIVSTAALDPDRCGAVIFNQSTGKFNFGRGSGAGVSFSPGTTNCVYEFKHKNTPGVSFQVSVDNISGDVIVQ
jgi:type II secretory pathway pseudopilin PulG